MWLYSDLYSVNPPLVRTTLWPCSIFFFLLHLSPPCRTLGGIQKSCWTQLNTWATNAPATWNSPPRLSPLLPTLLLLSCLRIPTLSTHPMSLCIPTQPSSPMALELHSLSPKSNLCDMRRNSYLGNLIASQTLHGKTTLCWPDLYPSSLLPFIL